MTDICVLGSIQEIDGIPPDVKGIYKTAWEVSQKVVIDMAADRGPFICQSQSMSIFLSEPTMKQLVSVILSRDGSQLNEIIM